MKNHVGLFIVLLGIIVSLGAAILKMLSKHRKKEDSRRKPGPKPSPMPKEKPRPGKLGDGSEGQNPEEQKRKEIKKKFDNYNRNINEKDRQLCYRESFEQFFGIIFCLVAQHLKEPENNAVLEVLNDELDDLRNMLDFLFTAKQVDKSGQLSFDERKTTTELQEIADRLIQPIIIPYGDALLECKSVISEMCEGNMSNIEQICRILDKYHFIFVNYDDECGKKHRIDFNKSMFDFPYPSLYFDAKGDYILIRNGGVI